MIYLGIDPGQQGAIVMIEIVKKEKKITIYDMPLLSEKGISAFGIWSYLIQIDEIFCILEKAQALPQQSSTAGFNYGMGYGKILSVLEILKIPFEEVRPMKWRKEYSLPTGKDVDKKGAAAKVAIQLYPELKEKFYTPRGKLLDGRVEALLMADYAERRYGRK